LIVKDILDLLSNDDALVLFASGDKETCVFAVTPTAVATKVIPGAHDTKRPDVC
jgi:hypothetical protein